MKKPYQKPAIVHTEKIEARAVVCGPVGTAKGSSVDCPSGPISS